MPTVLDVKICGLKTIDTVKVAVKAGANHIGFIFYPPSPRAISPQNAAYLARFIPNPVKRVAVFVNARDEKIFEVVKAVSPHILQLHGTESPERVLKIKELFRIPIMKAIKISTSKDIDLAHIYDKSADIILFDTKPPEEARALLPGGNGLAFDWELLTSFRNNIPWFLSGGLDAENVQKAIQISGARSIDVSSGVESRPGEKQSSKILSFIEAVHKC